MEEEIDVLTVDTSELDHVPDADDDDVELLFLPTHLEPQLNPGEDAAEGGGGAADDGMDVDGDKGGKAGRKRVRPSGGAR